LLGPRLAIAREMGSEIPGTKLAAGLRLRSSSLVLGVDVSYRPADAPTLFTPPSHVVAMIGMGFDLSLSSPQHVLLTLGLDALAIVTAGVLFFAVEPLH
jgi:hypothetical protein